MTEQDTTRLLCRFLDGEITEEESQVLLARVETDPSLLKEAVDLYAVDGLLASVGRENELGERIARSVEALELGDAHGTEIATGVLRQVRSGSARKRYARPVRRLPIWLRLSAAAFVVIAGAWFAHRQWAASIPLASVTAISGNARTSAPDGRRARQLRVGNRIAAGQIILTHKNSRVTFRYEKEMTHVTLGQSARVSMAGSHRAKCLQLHAGTLAASVAPQSSDNTFVVITPQAEAMAIGTAFKVGVSGAATRLATTEGKVRLTRISDRKSVEVTAGHYAVASPNAELTTMPSFTEVLSFDFEDGKRPAVLEIGDVVDGPSKPGSRYCVRAARKGKYTTVVLADYQTGVFTYHKGLVFSLDYWVSGGMQEALIQIGVKRPAGWENLRSVNIKAQPDRWNHATVWLHDLFVNKWGTELAKVKPADRIPQDGEPAYTLGIVIHPKGPPDEVQLYVDNMLLTRDVSGLPLPPATNRRKSPKRAGPTTQSEPGPVESASRK